MDEDEMPIASVKRMLLAIYIDFVVFALIMRIVAVFFGDIPVFFIFGLFTVYEKVVTSLRISFGFYVLSISRDEVRNCAVVDAEVKKKESWITVLFGALMINGGVKMFAGDMAGRPRPPFFGLMTDSLAYYLATGAFCLYMIYFAWCVLKVRRETLWVGLGYCILLCSAVYFVFVNKEALNLFYEQWVNWNLEVRKREVTSQVIDMMQPIFYGGAVASSLISLLVSWRVWVRSKRGI